MSFWGAIAGGAVGTTVLVSGLRVAAALGWTRLDVPLLLGTMFTESRRRAILLGYGLQYAIGLGYSAIYGAVFEAIGHAGWLLGLGLGAVHAAFFGGVALNVLLPAFHPRMGTPWSDARETPLLEPPGFMLANYGRGTLLVTAAMHLAYGAIVGAFAAS